jgi:hypothetical protein
LKLKNNDVTIYAYDKYQEMKSKEDIYTADDISLAENVLRIELQIARAKIQNEKKKSGLQKMADFLEKAIKEACEYFNHYLRKLFLEGDYYSYDTAMRLIDESRYNDKIKEKLKKLVTHVSDTDSVVNGITAMKDEIRETVGIDDYNSGKAHNKIKNMIDKLCAIGVNPVTIPNQYNIDRLRSLNYFTLDNFISNFQDTGTIGFD